MRDAFDCVGLAGEVPMLDQLRIAISGTVYHVTPRDQHWPRRGAKFPNLSPEWR
jgi:hypothetical protein|tara:strand:+ start:2499 stop:2660 length:162 start_codon:yes stop_codon:yes gene_type:complete